MPERWSRLSITDLLIATACISCGFAISRRIPDAQFAVLTGVSIGLLLWGPATFAYQWMRGRRLELAGGEVIWLAMSGLVGVSIVLGAASIMGSRYLDGSLVLTGLLFAFLCIDVFSFAVLTLFGMVGLLNVIFGTRARSDRRWTDIVGCLVGELPLIIILYSVVRESQLVFPVY